MHYPASHQTLARAASAQAGIHLQGINSTTLSLLQTAFDGRRKDYEQFLGLLDRGNSTGAKQMLAERVPGTSEADIMLYIEGMISLRRSVSHEVAAERSTRR